MKDHYQLAVIGAGPAGGYAALTAARRGIDVLLLDRREEIGFPPACAEGISEKGLTRFITPDPLFIATEIFAITFTVGNGFQYTYRSPDRLGYVLDRPRFDRFLVEESVRQGADLWTRAFVSGVDISSDHPVRIRIERPDGPTTVTADYVIAADGVESMVGRMVGICTLLPLRQSESSLQYRVAGIDLDPRCMEFCVGEKYSPNGYLWVFPKSNNTANIGLGLNPAESGNDELRKRLDRFLGERYGRYTIEFENGGMVPKFTGLDNLGRDNLLLAGDAARTIDSLTGAGIARALHTGQLAAQTVAEALVGKITRRDVVETYRGAVDREIGKDLRFLHAAYQVFRRFDDADWEAMIRFLQSYLAKQKAGSIDPAMMIKSALAQAPRLMRLARHVL
jgi:digeranylgeranylglycerophospholipid reductase